MKTLLDNIARTFGLRVVKASRRDNLIYQHIYDGGYEEYRIIQTEYNQKKLHNVWADETTLSAVVDDMRGHGLGASGICHGARNGFEVSWLRRTLGGEVIGTDISETATKYPDLHVWDFHDENPAWERRFDFVYTNSLDHAIEPARALKVWAKQIVPGGRIYIEHTIAHSPDHAGKKDPFGAHPMVMPYLFFVWGRECYQLKDILVIDAKQNNGFQAWVFVLTLVDPSLDELP